MVLKDPEKPDNYLVRRLAAIEGYEMLSTDEKDEPFVLDKDECWVLADNESLKPKVQCHIQNFYSCVQTNVSNIIARLLHSLHDSFMSPSTLLFMFYYLAIAVAQQLSILSSLHMCGILIAIYWFGCNICQA